MTGIYFHLIFPYFQLNNLTLALLVLAGHQEYLIVVLRTNEVSIFYSFQKAFEKNRCVYIGYCYLRLLFECQSNVIHSEILLCSGLTNSQVKLPHYGWFQVVLCCGYASTENSFKKTLKNLAILGRAVDVIKYSGNSRSNKYTLSAMHPYSNMTDPDTQLISLEN